MDRHPSETKTRCRPVRLSLSWGETQPLVQPASDAGSHWEEHSTTSPGRTITKRFSPKPGWLQAAVPAPRHRASTARKQAAGGHMCCTKRKRSFLHQMEHFLLNNPQS